jgi:transcriptional regulator with XRE-family HTH domain
MERLTPTTILTTKRFGHLLRLLRTMAGWSQQEAGARYHCVAGLVSLRETGQRAVNVEQAAKILGQHGYVLVVMHADDAAQLPRLRWDGEDA